MSILLIVALTTLVVTAVYSLSDQAFLWLVDLREKLDDSRKD
jgi:hypothetical protein